MLRVQRYYFFPPIPPPELQGRSGKSHLELGSDESAGAGQLQAVADVLQEAHARFFGAEDPAGNDMRVVLASIRAKILAGTHVVFSRVRDLRFFSVLALVSGNLHRLSVIMAHTTGMEADNALHEARQQARCHLTGLCLVYAKLAALP